MGKTTKEAAAELEAAKAKMAAVQRKLHARLASANKLLAHSEAKLKSLKAEPASDRRSHLLELYELRRQLALRSREMLQLFASTDPSDPRASAATRVRAEQLDAEMKVLGLVYSVSNYRPIIRTVQQSLQKPATGPLGGGAAPTGRLAQRQQPSGRLTAPPAGGTGRLSQPPAQPGAPAQAPRAGTGPLGQARLQQGGTGALSQRAAGAPGAPGAAARGTGPLAARAEGASASGPAGTSPLTRSLGAAIAQAIGEPNVRQNLEQVLRQYEEIEAAAALLQGPEPGSVTLGAADVSAAVGKIAGQIYYMRRTVESMPTLAPMMSFDPENEDAELAQYMATTQMAAEPAADASGGTLSSKLKSLFGAK